MVSTDRPCKGALLKHRIRTSTKPNGVGDHPDGREDDWATGDEQRCQREPALAMVGDDLNGERGDRDDHDDGDEMPHGPRRRGDAPIIRGDGTHDRLRKLGSSMAKNLDVEHEVHPQHGEQEAAARSKDQGLDVHRRRPWFPVITADTGST